MKKLFTLLTLLVAIVTGAQAADLVDKYTGFKFNSGSSIAEITMGTGVDVNTKSLRVAKNATGSFTLTVKPTGYRIKSVVFTEESNSKGISSFTSDDGTIVDNGDKTWTFTPTGTKTTATFSVTATSSGNALIKQVYSTITNDVDEDCESLVPSATTSSALAEDAVIGMTSTLSSSYVTIKAGTNGSVNVKNQNDILAIDFGSGKGIKVEATRPIKQILFSWYQRPPTADADWSPSVGTFSYTEHTWTAPNNETTAVTFTRTQSSAAEITNIHVIYYPTVVTPEFSLTSNSIGMDETAQIVVGTNEGLDGLTMNNLSYDSNVIEIDANGAITPKAPGSTTITFTTAAVEGKYNAGTASLPITVTAAKADTQLSFGSPTTNVELNGTVQNVATLTGGPEGATITYASSDETVATVAADGTVTGQKIGGTATITASYAGNDEYKASEASYEISVVAPALVAVDDYVWNGNDWLTYFNIPSKGSLDIASTTWVDNLELVATSDNKITIKDNNSTSQTTPDFAEGFKVRVRTNGVSTADARYVHFIVKPNTKITAYAIRTGDAGGTFALATGSIDNEVASHEFTDGGGIETIDYIYTGSENADVYAYATVNGAQFVAFRVAPLVEVTISDAGAASFSSTQAIDFAGSEVTAYQATAKSESYVHLDEITKLPAGAGAIIKAPAGTYKVAVANCVTPALTDNLLVGTGENSFTVTSAEYGKVFKYAKRTSDNVVGFQKAKEGWICQAGHAYLMFSETQARDFIGIFGEEEVVTGIDAIENGTIDNDAPAYNLAGQKVGKGYKGIVIINGKKVVK